MKMRVVFFGNSQSVFSNRHFQALVKTSCETVGLVDVPPSKRTSTNPAMTDFPSFVEVAHQRKIIVFNPISPNLPEFIRTISDLSPDLFVAVGYTNLLKEHILSVPRIFAVNFHASLLPAYRGKHPIFWALRNGESWAGLTVHVMDTKLDTGDILYQVRVRTRKNDSVATLYDRIMVQSTKLVDRLIDDAEKNKLRSTPQPESGASYYSSVCEDDFRLDWYQPAERLRRWIQTSPDECFCDISGCRIFFTDAEAVTNTISAPPGTLIQVGRVNCIVAAGKDSLRIHKGRINKGSVKPMATLCRELGFGQGYSLG
jgi:UDP-4-amino-4-deoxy-L-arabinose formyltransferase/UDP-glucuronic acid dehydrogenase (UDP-4-keto-hexauronic acid decarboxylating)